MSSVSGLGHKSYFAFAKEDVFGVFKTPTAKVPILAFDPAQQGGLGIDGSLWGTLGDRGAFRTGRYYKGRLSMPLTYEGLEELVRAPLSGYTRTQVSTTATYDTTYKPADVLPSLSGEIVLDGFPSGKCWRVLGLKLLNPMIRGRAGSGDDARLVIDFDWVAQDILTGQTPTGSLSFPAWQPVLYDEAIIVDDGTVEGGQTVATSSAIAATTSGGPNLTRPSGSFVTDGWTVGMLISCTNVPAGTYAGTVGATSIGMVKADGTAQNATGTGSGLTATGYQQLRALSFEFSVDQPHVEDRLYIGSTLIADPVRNGPPVATLRIEQEYVTRTQFDMRRATTPGSPMLLFRSGTPFGTSPETYREFEVRLGTAYLSELSDPIEGPTVIKSTATWRGVYDATDAAVAAIRLRNQMAALT